MKGKVMHILMLLLAAPLPLKAQWSFDVPSVEAYIADHKNERSLLLARATLEQSNALLHSYTKDAGKDYRDISVDLDRYTRAFDVIDVMYQTLRTSLNAYDTYDTFRRRVSEYRDMLTLFHDKCLMQVDIVSTDTLIVAVNRHMLEAMADEAQGIYRSFSDLVLYVTGAAACTTSDLMLVLGSINTSLENMRRHLNAAYFETWRYIQLRTGYWKAQVYRAKTIPEILEGAYGRWREAGRLDNEQ